MESNQLNKTPDEDAIIELLTLTCEIDKFGNKFYLNKEGLFHRIYGPAVVWHDNGEAWYKNGLNHRENGPSVIHKNYKAWHKNDMFHREDGPARIFESGKVEYYIDGKLLTKREFIQWQKKNGIKPIK